MSNGYDICNAGTSRLDKKTNLPLWQCTNPITDAIDDTEHFGEIPVFSSLGVTSLPAPPDAGGFTEVVVLRDCGGLDGVIIGARDPREAEVVAALKPGETCLHSTGKGFASRVFCKDESVSMVIGADTILTLSRKDGKFQVAVAGHIFEMSEENGISIADSGGGAHTIKDGAHFISGTAVVIHAATVLGDKDATDFVALAALVKAEIEALATTIATTTIVPNDGGAAIALAVSNHTVGSVESELVKAK